MPISTVAAISPASEAVVATARAWVGTPYRHQASLRAIGCDCIGLVRGVWRDLGGRPPAALPAYAPDWAETGGRELLLDGLARFLKPIPLRERQAGAVIAFRWREGCIAKHAGILLGEDRMIHVHEGITVSEVQLSRWWLQRLAGAYLYTV